MAVPPRKHYLGPEQHRALQLLANSPFGASERPLPLSPPGTPLLHRRECGAARKLLEVAACNGEVGAAWELGRMYADRDGVRQNHQLAFHYFGSIAVSHADEPTGTVPARFVANAFVSPGGYYLTGSPNSDIKPGCRLRLTRANISLKRFWAPCCSRANTSLATAHAA
jgi:hypothetical protein